MTEHAIDLFLSKNNLLYLWGTISAWKRNHGTPSVSYEYVESAAVEWSINFKPPETESSIAAAIVSDYYNREFTKSLTQGRFNPFKSPVNGVYMSDLMPEDYGKLDYWEPNHIFAVEQPTKKARGNPHIIGAHRRHYESTEEGLRQHEKGPERTSGWDMNIFDEM